MPNLRFQTQTFRKNPKNYGDENRLTWWQYTANLDSTDVASCGSNPQTDNDAASQFLYDGLRRLREQFDSRWDGMGGTPTEAYCLYDGWRVIQECKASPYYFPQVSYTRGNDLSGTLEGAGGIGSLLARTDNSKLNLSDPFATTIYHADGNGNVTVLIYTNATMAAKYLYDPYGNTLAQSGPLAEANAYRFSSKEWDENAGLYYYLYRFYDPNLQRWPNRDPIQDLGSISYDRMRKRALWIIFLMEQGQSGNGYQFANNNSVIMVDALGLQVWTPPSNVNAPPSTASPPRCPNNPCPGGHEGTNAELLGYGSVTACANDLFGNMVTSNPILSITGGTLSGVSGGTVVSIGGGLTITVTAVVGAGGGIFSYLAFLNFCDDLTCIYP